MDEVEETSSPGPARGAAGRRGARARLPRGGHTDEHGRGRRAAAHAAEPHGGRCGRPFPGAFAQGVCGVGVSFWGKKGGVCSVRVRWACQWPTKQGHVSRHNPVRARTHAHTHACKLHCCRPARRLPLPQAFMQHFSASLPHLAMALADLHLGRGGEDPTFIKSQASRDCRPARRESGEGGNLVSVVKVPAALRCSRAGRLAASRPTGICL